ncbi:TetR family transcriptional regulator [Nocardia sp. 852002-20019_SCH5090214]|uniref:TetR/AcrR family transcriptional regulator n=1 Tax=Nocardia TaxID=1817 RepID=UPI0007EAE6DD|nr:MULTISPECIES: TetR/AcrR family transcriptional regulator [Nocardia]MBV7705758.1 TetR/AcrR family transcriptional regulator [Nocardia nova]OBA67818.1 TetR family transcriptional regulator [Nocardia sp. 852002-20019_SCH5090214]
MNHATAAPAPRRLRADAARNHARILRAARELFADRGLEVTLDDVAEAAGVGVGTVYRRFANKQELIGEVFDQTVNDMAEATEAAYADPDTWHGLTRLFEWSCEHMASNRGFGEVMLELPDAMERFVSVRERIKPMVTRLFDKAVAEGVLRPGIAASDFFAMINMVEAIASFAKPVNPDVWRRYMSIVLDGVRGDCIPRQPLTVPPLNDDDIDNAKEAVFACRRK